MVHLDDPDLLAGDQVAQAIGRLGDAAAVPLLLPALSDADQNVRARAATALGLLHAEEAIPQLSDHATTGWTIGQTLRGRGVGDHGFTSGHGRAQRAQPAAHSGANSRTPGCTRPVGGVTRHTRRCPGRLLDPGSDGRAVGTDAAGGRVIGRGPRRPKAHFGPA